MPEDLESDLEVVQIEDWGVAYTFCTIQSHLGEIDEIHVGGRKTLEKSLFMPYSHLGSSQTDHKHDLTQNNGDHYLRRTVENEPSVRIFFDRFL